MARAHEDEDWVADVADKLPVSPLSALGLFLVAVISVRVTAESLSWRAIFESLFPIVAATAVVGADRWLVANEVAPRDRLTVFAYGLGGFLAASLVTGLHMYALYLEGLGHPDPLYMSLLSGTVGVAAGTLAGYYEIRQRAALREARRQTDRLEEFASIVSHDLRNPLGVARGRLREAFRTGEARHLTEVETALNRMDELIEDTLAVARSGSQVREPDRVPLVDLAYDAWEGVETEGATLETAGNRPLSVDRSRAKTLFENLFRNAVEHGVTGADDGDAIETADGDADGADDVSADGTGGEAAARTTDDTGVTVRVGPLSNGFYVEDDGPGIPESERPVVFEQGYSSDVDGSGLGLAIVRAIADAHGWSASVGESDAGGARFEFRRS